MLYSDGGDNGCQVSNDSGEGSRGQVPPQSKYWNYPTFYSQSLGAFNGWSVGVESLPKHAREASSQ